MKQITKLELLTIRDALKSVLEDADYDSEEILDALEIVEALLTTKEVTDEDIRAGH